MPAYIIAILERENDPAALAEYKRKAGPTMPPEMKPLAAYGPFEVLEGGPIEGAVIMQFPDFAAAKAWYDSPGYEEAKALRQRGGDYRMLIVEGR